MNTIKSILLSVAIGLIATTAQAGTEVCPACGGTGVVVKMMAVAKPKTGGETIQSPQQPVTGDPRDGKTESQTSN